LTAISAAKADPLNDSAATSKANFRTIAPEKSGQALQRSVKSIPKGRK
jgi:hypothetical protein